MSFVYTREQSIVDAAASGFESGQRVNSALTAVMTQRLGGGGGGAGGSGGTRAAAFGKQTKIRCTFTK